MSKPNSLLRAAVLAAALVLGACAHTEPFAYESYNEVKPGRGVFTGEAGTWTIFRQEMPPENQIESSEEKGSNHSGAGLDGEEATTPAESVAE